MRFPIETREAIYESRGRPIEIDWPEGRFLPEPHRSYTVQSSARAGQLEILVLKSLDDGLRALVKIDSDPVNSLRAKGIEHLNSDLYGPQFRAVTEPEQPSKADVSEMGRLVKRARVERIKGTLDELYEQLSEMQDDPDFSHARSDVRFIHSLTRKLEKRLTREDIRYLDDLQEAS